MARYSLWISYLTEKAHILVVECLLKDLGDILAQLDHGESGGENFFADLKRNKMRIYFKILFRSWTSIQKL